VGGGGQEGSSKREKRSERSRKLGAGEHKSCVGAWRAVITVEGRGGDQEGL